MSSGVCVFVCFFLFLFYLFIYFYFFFWLFFPFGCTYYRILGKSFSDGEVHNYLHFVCAPVLVLNYIPICWLNRTNENPYPTTLTFSTCFGLERGLNCAREVLGVLDSCWHTIFVLMVCAPYPQG